MALFSLDALTTTSDKLLESLVQPYHLIDPQGTYAVNKCRQEYWWGLQWGQLDLKTPLNTIYVRSDVIPLLKEEKIMLAPTEETLQQMDRMQQRQKQLFRRGAHDEREVFTEVFPEMEYEYIIIPLRILNDESPLYVHDPSTGRVERYDAPYTTLPHFRSFAHPFFVVEGSFGPYACNISLVPEELEPIASLLGRVGCYTGTCPPDPFYETVYTPAPPGATGSDPVPLDDDVHVSPLSSPSNPTVFSNGDSDSLLTPYTKRICKWRKECNPADYEYGYEYNDHEVPRRLTDIDFSDCPGWTEDTASRRILSSSDWMRLYRKGEIDVVYPSCDERSDSDGYSDCAT